MHLVEEVRRKVQSHDGYRLTGELKGAVGEIGDNRLTVMAGIAVVDELAEAERKIKALETEVLVLTRAGQEVAAEIETLEARFAGKLADAARALEGVAGVLDETAPVPHG